MKSEQELLSIHSFIDMSDLRVPFTYVFLCDPKQFTTCTSVLLFEPVQLEVVLLGTEAFMDLVNNNALPFEVLQWDALAGFRERFLAKTGNCVEV